ncbi:MAG: hypothetical protein IKR57_04285 [Bacilli bacterium]|nr:hypothetical protein [Bacilli bacterium]
MFKKLFTFKYNNKEFLLLVNEDHRYAFMEIKNGELVYPDIEDFKYLFNVFNVRDKFVASKWIGDRLEDKVNYKGTILSVIFSASLVFPMWLDATIKINEYNNSLTIESQNEAVLNTPTQFYSITDLNAYLGYKDISLEDVFKVIDENENFSDKQREIVKKILEEKARINPDIDLRLIYENMKDLKIEYRTYDELLEMFNIPMAGCFCYWDDTIYLTDIDNDGLFAHEISHAMHGVSRIIDGKYIGFSPGRSCFHEVMTNKEGSLGVDYKLGDNGQDERMLNFLLDHADKFDLSVYDEYGLDPLIDELKEKYPTVDIDYIIDFFNGAYEAGLKIDGEKISMFDNEYLLDQVYEITVCSIDKDDLFSELNDLYRLLDYKEEYCKKYSQKYFKHLLDEGYIGTSEYDFITKLDHLVLKNQKFYLGTSDNKYYNLGLELIDEDDSCFDIPMGEMSEQIINDYGQGTFVFDDEYISSLIKDGSILNEQFAEAIKDYDEDAIKDIIDTIFFKMLEDCETLEEIQEQYLLFKERYECLLTHDSNYMNVWRQSIREKTYFNYYRDLCIAKEFSSEEDMKIVSDLEYIVEYKGIYYLVKSKSDVVNNIGIRNYATENVSQETDVLTSEPIVMIYLDENNEEKELVINKDLFVLYRIRDCGFLKIQTYLENHDSKVLSQEMIKDLIDECDLKNDDIYANAFTLSSGEVVYDGVLDDSIFIEFGKNDKGEITFQITKDNNVIYKSCEDFVPLSSKIEYKKYIDVQYFNNDNHLDELTSQNSITEAMFSLQVIMKDVKLTYKEYEETIEIKDEETKEVTYRTIPRLETIIDFIKPVIVNIDGDNCYARDNTIFCDINDGYIYICYADGSKERIIHVNEIEGFDEYYDEVYYFNYLEYYLDYYQIVPDQNGVIYLTKNQLKELIINEIKDSLGHELGR